MTVSGPSALVSGAAALRVDVYDPPVSCASPSFGAAHRAKSVVFAPKEPMTLQVPPGVHAIVLTTFADAAQTVTTGRGCRDVDLAAGGDVCLDLALSPLGDGGLPGGGGATCGARGLPCCGTTCEANLACISGTCQCGGQAQPCCLGTTCNDFVLDCVQGVCTF